MFELAEIVISKNLIIFKVCIGKMLEFFLRHQILSFRATFLLMPLFNYCFSEKRDGKKDSI